jgi:hypothetical protein
MMNERGKSDPVIVAVKPANKAEQSAAESVEPRAGAKGNADQQSTRRAQYRESVSQALGRIRQVSPSSTRGRSRMHKGARPDLCGGRGATRVGAASKAADLGGERPLPSIARSRTASISDAREGNEPRSARM